MAQAKIEPVSWMNVRVKSDFWSPRQKSLLTHTLREQFDQLVSKKYKQNFERAAKRLTGGYVGYVFNDSDVYKVLEAASYTLGIERAPWLEKELDEWIDLISRAQEPDGYLDCHYQLMEPKNKWTNLRDNHEMYCAGHLFEAAAAHYQATGKTTFLNVARKLADHMDARFGPGKRMGYPGHPETELALFKLARATSEQRYFKLAEFFLNSRGSKWFATEHNTPMSEYNGDYWSDNAMIRDHDTIIGHAVRAAYLMSGATDLARATDDPKLVSMLDRIWASTTEKRMFVTGGIGPSGSNEGFTVDYDLPTFSAYQESCASIANALWNYRMALLHGDGKYADVMETAIYNGSLAGINYQGDKYYYTNPLASHGGHHRQDWFACACCPPNLARLIGQVGGLAYAQSADAAYVMLYVGGSAKLNVGRTDVGLKVDTKYPYDGSIKVTVDPAVSKYFTLNLRVPSWVEGIGIRVNGRSERFSAQMGFAKIQRTWKKGDSVTMDIDMRVRRVISHPSVKETFGMYSFERGPLVYCLEGVDNKFDMDKMGVPVSGAVVPKVDPSLFGGTVILEGDAFLAREQDWNGKLFADTSTTSSVKFRAIPYCFWDNRGSSEMRVWVNPNPMPSPLRGMEKDASVSMSFKSPNSDPGGVNDGYIPSDSNQNSPRQCHFWPHKGGQEWVQYSFPSDRTVTSTRIYWFDDTGHGECRIPRSWVLQVKEGNDWKTVPLKQGETYSLVLNAWNEVHFAPVKGQEFRILLDQQKNWASGIHEWQIY
ncbi:MAG: beta-L-arabinofuranosidase domain-containing protein [Armatimonadota bacterium]